MTDPRDLTPDQRELLDAFEAVALLDPEAATMDDLVEAFDRVLTLLEARVQQTKGRGLLDVDLAAYGAGFLRDGHVCAAEGAALMRWRLAGEIAHASNRN